MMWEEVKGKLVKKFSFADFVQALAFVNRIGELAEQVNHHPDITFGWGYVEVTLFSHSEGKITEKDTQLASRIDEL